MDSLLLAKIFALMVLPPGGIFLLLFGGLLLSRVRRRLGNLLMGLALVLGLGLSMPVVSNALIGALEQYPPLDVSDPSLREAVAIVLLGGGRREFAPEYGGETVSALSLERVRYAAKLGRELELPILISGGSVRGETVTEATLMAAALAEFGVKARWLEQRSRNTHENAEFSSAILRGANLAQNTQAPRVVLVTHAFHLRRALRRFERAGLDPIPAPTGYFVSALPSSWSLALIPQARALVRSSMAIWEWGGELWYRLRY